MDTQKLNHVCLYCQQPVPEKEAVKVLVKDFHEVHPREKFVFCLTCRPKMIERLTHSSSQGLFNYDGG